MKDEMREELMQDNVSLDNPEDFEETKEENKQFLEDFEYTLREAELKALMKHSLIKPLTNEQYQRVMELKKELYE